MSSKYFKLDQNKNVVPTNDIAECFGPGIDRRVDRTKIGDVSVSTVFLGIDHGWGVSGPPLIFETMVFGGPLDQEQERYYTWTEAVAGHKAMVKRVRKEAKK